MTSGLEIPSAHRVQAMRRFLEIGQIGIRDARWMRSEAKHHADIRVGAVGLAMSDEGGLRLFNGANQNLYPGENASKVCAEQVVMQKMLHSGYKRLIAMFVSGPPQPDTHSSYEFPTLHSCGNCRIHMSELGFEDLTLVVSSHPILPVHEIFKLPDLLVSHSGKVLPFPQHVYTDLESITEEQSETNIAVFNLYTAGLLPNTALRDRTLANIGRTSFTGELVKRAA